MTDTIICVNRLRDILVSGVALVFLSPVLLVVSLIIRIKLGSPVLFSQVRPGLNARPFRMYKFRSMTDERDASGELLPDGARLTAFGRALRSTSLDEVPALYNVLKGDMSLVGPRPLLMRYLSLYNAHQARRMNVLPGVTGWAQVNGRNTISWEQKFEYDIWYVENKSFVLDLKILYLTFVKVMRRDDISEVGGDTMTEFRGTK